MRIDRLNALAGRALNAQFFFHVDKKVGSGAVEDFIYLLKTLLASVVRVRDLSPFEFRIKLAHEFHLLVEIRALGKPEDILVVAPVHSEDEIKILQVVMRQLARAVFDGDTVPGGVCNGAGICGIANVIVGGAARIHLDAVLQVVASDLVF